jgi:capsular polysaccharide biosynthesis protein
VAETLAYTNPRDHAYRGLVRGIALQLGQVARLPGTHISLLTAGQADYRQAMLGGLARLTSVPDMYLVAAQSILVPAGGALQAEALGLLDLLPSLGVREIGPTETLRVETLVFPLSVCGEAAYHPCLAEFFRRISANTPPSPGKLPRRVYLDHRGSGIRPLRNEAALIGALAELGFEPVRLDTLSLQDQIRLFRQAEAIVSPHGSALTNLGFCRPGCLVVELLMDAFVDWSFRNLAALMDLRYDCVLGRARLPWQDLDLAFHLTPWDISVNHVVAAVAHSLAAPRRQSAAA